jgi:hypothetical protein
VQHTKSDGGDLLVTDCCTHFRCFPSHLHSTFATGQDWSELNPNGSNDFHSVIFGPNDVDSILWNVHNGTLSDWSPRSDGKIEAPRCDVINLHSARRRIQSDAVLIGRPRLLLNLGSVWYTNRSRLFSWKAPYTPIKSNYSIIPSRALFPAMASRFGCRPYVLTIVAIPSRMTIDGIVRSSLSYIYIPRSGAWSFEMLALELQSSALGWVSPDCQKFSWCWASTGIAIESGYLDIRLISLRKERVGSVIHAQHQL